MCVRPGEFKDECEMKEEKFDEDVMQAYALVTPEDQEAGYVMLAPGVGCTDADSDIEEMMAVSTVGADAATCAETTLAAPGCSQLFDFSPMYGCSCVMYFNDCDLEENEYGSLFVALAGDTSLLVAPPQAQEVEPIPAEEPRGVSMVVLMGISASMLVIGMLCGAFVQPYVIKGANDEVQRNLLAEDYYEFDQEECMVGDEDSCRSSQLRPISMRKTTFSRSGYE